MEVHPLSEEAIAGIVGAQDGFRSIVSNEEYDMMSVLTFSPTEDVADEHLFGFVHIVLMKEHIAKIVH